MGFFNTLNKSAETVSNAFFGNSCEAFVAVMVCAISADGCIDDLEIDAMSKMLSFKRSFQGLDVFEFYKKALALITEHGCDTVSKTAAGMLSEAEKKSALVTTIDLLFANGVVNDKEQHFVDDLAMALDLDRTWARNAIDVIVLKYN